MSKPKFLIDENVRKELFDFLEGTGLDVKVLSKGVKDEFLASVSKKESRILVTNDEDFCVYTKDEVFGIILLKIPQSDAEGLIDSFKRISKMLRDFSGKMIILRVGKYQEIPLKDNT